jgi:hypothetical protein
MVTADRAAASCRIADYGSTLLVKSPIPRIQSMAYYPGSLFMCERLGQHVETAPI